MQVKTPAMACELFLLEERRDRYGVLALVEKEYAIGCIDQQLEDTGIYIDELTRRKAEF